MLHQNDLIFCKTESGVTSCGYNISNMLLKNTLNTPHSQYGHHVGNINKTSKDDIRIAKLMEDLVVPSGLYYCHPMTKHKVFNYKSMQAPQSLQSSQSQEKGDKGEKHEIDITNGMLDESVYDKLLSLVSMDKRKVFDKKTRKNKGAIFQKVKDGAMVSDMDMDVDVAVDVPKQEKGEKGEKEEKGDKTEKGEKPNKKKSLKLKIKLQPQQQQEQQQKPNQRKTKKVRFA